MMIEIPAPGMALIGLAMFATPLAVAGFWAVNKANELDEQRKRESDDALYREVYGPAGKPNREPTTGPELH